VYPDLADPLPTVVPTGVAGHDPDRCAACAPDPEAAADIVRFVFPDGAPTVRIDFDESTAQEAMARIIAADLDAVGIPTELRPQPLEAYKRFVVSGRQELFSFGWIGAYGSPDAYLAPLFSSAANDNLTDYRSVNVDGYLRRARSARDDAKNAERWALAEAQVLEAAVVIPIAQFRTQVVLADRVLGFVHATDGTVDWAQVQVTG
jgi:ABC-type transport system substrate-binding protein